MYILHTTQIMKELARCLKNLSCDERSVEEVNFGYLPNESIVCVEATFFVEISCGITEMLIGKAVIQEKYISQKSDDELIKYIVESIALDIETQILNNEEIPVRLH